MENPQLMVILFGGLALVLGIATIVVQRMVSHHYETKIEKSIKTEGRIIGFKKKSVSRDSTGHYYPILSYKDNRGNTYELISKVRRGTVQMYQDLDQLPPEIVYYNPEKPIEAFIYIPAVKYLPMIVGGSFTLMCLCFAIVALFMRDIG